ncbi:MAG: TniQ family protein, partial [Roseiarcus sp.]
MTLEPTRCGQLPVVLPPAADELLSSWVRRHAVFYDVSPLVMLRHCRVDMSSLRAVDLRLTDEQASRFASMFRMEVANVQRMSLSNISPKSRRFIAAKPMQFCANCSRQLNSNGSELTRRSQLLGWRLSCPQCGSALFDNRGHASTSPFAAYRTEALNGQRLIDDEAERGVRTWASPTELARLLLMRRDPRTGYSATNNNLRLLGGVVPDIDAVVA